MALEVVASVGAPRLPAIEGKILLTDESLERFQIEGRQRELAVSQIIDGTGQPLGRVLRVSTASAARSEWDVQLVAEMDSGVTRGDVVLARFWMRCIDSLTGEGFVTF